MPIIDFDSECWGDPWVQERSPLGKLLFVYLWTNTHRNKSGLYVITQKTMSDETGLNRKQINDVLTELFPKVQYDPKHCICWVIKHTRRQFLRTGSISEQLKKGIRNDALKLCYHPFFLNFMEQYPEIFTPEEKETLYRPYTDSPRGSIDPPGEGKGEGKGILKEEGVQGEKEKFFEEFWELYPLRDGRKLLKDEAKEFFLKKIKDEEVGAVLQAVRNYRVSKTVTDGYGRDAIRFLRKNFWRSWVEQSAPTPQAGFKGAKLWLEAKERQDEKARQRSICHSNGKTPGDIPHQPHA